MQISHLLNDYYNFLSDICRSFKNIEETFVYQ